MTKKNMTLPEIQAQLEILILKHQNAEAARRIHLGLVTEVEQFEYELSQQFPGKYSYEVDGIVYYFGTLWPNPELPTLEELFNQQSQSIEDEPNA